jgi:hypothetical protein
LAFRRLVVLYTSWFFQNPPDALLVASCSSHVGDRRRWIAWLAGLSRQLGNLWSTVLY